MANYFSYNLKLVLLLATVGWAMAAIGSSILDPPIGNSVLLRVKGSGVQRYRCEKNGYKLLRAAADLFSTQETDEIEEKVVGYHYFLSRADAEGGRPTWSTVATLGDSTTSVPASTVTGTVIATQPKDGKNIADLLLKATSHSGYGPLSQVAYIQRLESKGGVPPRGCWGPRSMIKVQYEAEYVFWVQETSLPRRGVPAELHVGEGNRPVMSYYGEGVQNYVYDGRGWCFVNATASLSSSPGQQVVGKHYFLPRKDPLGGQPSWHMFLPDSRVTARALLTSASPDPHSIPWALLQTTSHVGDRFILGSVSYVMRISTRAGLPPTNATTRAFIGDKYSSPYSAIYWFFVPN